MRDEWFANKFNALQILFIAEFIIISIIMKLTSKLFLNLTRKTYVQFQCVYRALRIFFICCVWHILNDIKFSSNSKKNFFSFWWWPWWKVCFNNTYINMWINTPKKLFVCIGKKKYCKQLLPYDTLCYTRVEENM